MLTTTYAVMVMDAPQAPAQPVQVDVDIPSQPVNPDATLDSAVDIQVRTVAGGIYLTAAVTGTGSDAAPTGTVDFYDESGFLGTVAVSGAYRNALEIPAGPHTFFATYSGDENFLPSQTSVDATLVNPTNVATSATASGTFAENNLGERVRPTRLLSLTNYFTTHGMAVAADATGSGTQGDTVAQTPPPVWTGPDTMNDPLHAPGKKSTAYTVPQMIVMALPPVGSGDNAPSDVGDPAPLFSTVSFSIKVPKVKVVK